MAKTLGLGLLLVGPALNVMAGGILPPTVAGTDPPPPPGMPQPPTLVTGSATNDKWGTVPRSFDKLGSVPEGAVYNSNTDDYWLSVHGSAGVMPFAPSDYQFFRNVKDFGAVGDGITDDTEAINRAAATYGLHNQTVRRCGLGCGSTTTQGALVYFPPGTYLVSSPIIQYYYTQFVGNPTRKPTIKGSHNFTGIALIDTNMDIPDSNGNQWYISQNNFYRQIRNFVFDMTAMDRIRPDKDDEVHVPTGIHWQVGQASSITNCDFQMSPSTANQTATAVGIFMESGTGGFVSDLTFSGGNIGFVAGGQQFTARNLQFSSCGTAIKHLWNWGFNWKGISVSSCNIAIDTTTFSGAVRSQGIGSISVIDSRFKGVQHAITVSEKHNQRPNIVLDNLLVQETPIVILPLGGPAILNGSDSPLFFNSWSSGYIVGPDGVGILNSGFMDPTPSKPASLLSEDAYFTKSRPNYENDKPIVVTHNGISNNATGDQTDAINALLSENVGSLIYFPAGIYLVKGTLKIPVGSRITGSGWSQIMATGSYFEKADDPKVVVQVGNKGDRGTVEISDILFTVKGAMAGAVLVEWNVHEDTQGSACMWDSHFRVGGATGTDLQLADCPAGSQKARCMAASLMFHITSRASGYFENVWAWVADHDLDNPLNSLAIETDAGIPHNVQTHLAVFGARGILVESRGPTWLYASTSEHSQLYQYQIFNASHIYLGHVQTETPYYQPKPNALAPYMPGFGGFPFDPLFDDCADDLCKGAWGLRLLNSSDIFIYSAGLYSWFQHFDRSCIRTETCQLSLIQTDYVTGLWLYNIFTKGNIEIVSPNGGLAPLYFNTTATDGYTSEIAAWLQLSTGGGDVGRPSMELGSGDVTLDPGIWETPGANVSCFPPCTYIFPPITLPSPTTLVYPPLPTSIEVGWWNTTVLTWRGTASSTSIYFSTVISTTISIPPITTSIISLSDVVVSDTTPIVIHPKPSVIGPLFSITDPTVIDNLTIASTPSPRPFYPPPWPGSAWTSNPGYTTSPTSGEVTSASTSTYQNQTTMSMSSSTSGLTSVPTWTSQTTGTSASASQPTPSPTSTYPSQTTMMTSTSEPGGHYTSSSDLITSSVSQNSGPPNPRCTQAHGCGKKCTEGVFGDIFHRCDDDDGNGCGPFGIFCLPWPEPPFPAFPPPPPPPPPPPVGGPGNIGGSEDPTPSNTPSTSSCSTETYSSCRTVCAVASPTTSCSSTCKEIVGCDTSGTRIRTSYTPAGNLFGIECGTYNTNTAELWSAAQEVWNGVKTTPTQVTATKITVTVITTATTTATLTTSGPTITTTWTPSSTRTPSSTFSITSNTITETSTAVTTSASSISSGTASTVTVTTTLSLSTSSTTTTTTSSTNSEIASTVTVTTTVSPSSTSTTTSSTSSISSGTASTVTVTTTVSPSTSSTTTSSTSSTTSGTVSTVTVTTTVSPSTSSTASVELTTMTITSTRTLATSSSMPSEMVSTVTVTETGTSSFTSTISLSGTPTTSSTHSETIIIKTSTTTITNLVTPSKLDTTTITTTVATRTSPAYWPIHTSFEVGSSYCFTESMGYVPFAVDDAMEAVVKLCRSHRVLELRHTGGIVQKGNGNTYVAMHWAEDQSGCGTITEWVFSGPKDSDAYKTCIGMWTSDISCMEETEKSRTSYGGGYVFYTHQGCVLMRVYALPHTSSHIVPELASKKRSIDGAPRNDTASGEDSIWSSLWKRFANKSTGASVHV